MKKTHVNLLVGALALFIVSGTTAQAGDDTPMEKEMETVSHKLKKLRRMDKEDFSGGAKLIREAHEAFLRSMAYVPVVVKEITDENVKTLTLAESRVAMGETYTVLCKLEVAYLNKDVAKIKELTSKWKSQKRSGHKRYTK